MCSDDPFDDGVSDLVVDRLVVSAADEELILEGAQSLQLAPLCALRQMACRGRQCKLGPSRPSPRCRCSVCSWR